MRVIINCLSEFGPRTGVRHYTHQFLRCLRAQAADGEVHVFPNGMMRVVSDDAWWSSLRCGAPAVARPYTWERCAADTLGVYRRLCASSGNGSRAA